VTPPSRRPLAAPAPCSVGPDVGSLDGQVGLVTGASRGIGRAIAVALSHEGMVLGLLGRDRAALGETVADCPGRTHIAVADVTDHEAVRRALDEVEKALGPVDLLVNNAGRIDPAEVPVWEADPWAWWAVVETNLRGPFLLCGAVVPGMTARGHGRIVNINSGMGMRPTPDYSAYSVSKAALARLTDCLAGSLEGTGVAVFDVSPGLVRTEMTESMPMWAKATPEQWNPVGNITAAVLALARGEADALTGRFIHASRDDLSDLVSRAEQIRARDARTLRLRPYSHDDPAP
jgi:3-oxoacyl-[acyl-carrier protein] reductase